MTKRASALAGLALVLVLGSTAIGAQPDKKSHRIAWLGPAENTENLRAFRDGLRTLGYIEGKNVVIEERYVGQLPLRDVTSGLAKRNFDVILTDGSAVTSAVKQAGISVPVVFVSGDPVDRGLVANLSRPGGTMTGLAVFAKELNVKRLELLREALPRASRLGVLHEPEHRKAMLPPIEEAARKLGFRLTLLEVRNASDMPRAVAAAMKDNVTALMPVSSALFHAERQRLVALAAKNGLPAIYENRAFAEAGGLMSYGPDMSDVFRRAATYVHKIITGTKAADLPVEQPARFELIINQKAAKALGVTIPSSLRLQATQIIE